MSFEVVKKNLVSQRKGKRAGLAKDSGNAPRVGAPSNRKHVVVVTGVGTVQIERRELAGEVRRSLPDLDLRAVGHGNEPGRVARSACGLSVMDRVEHHSLAIGREVDVPDRLLEVEVMQDSRALEVDEDSTTVCPKCEGSVSILPPSNAHNVLTFIDADQDRRIGRESEASDILPVLEGECAGLVAAGKAGARQYIILSQTALPTASQVPSELVRESPSTGATLWRTNGRLT